MPARNRELIAALREITQGKASAGAIFLWGRSGAGKTHLLQAACRQVGELGMSAMYLPLAELRDEPESVLEGMDALALVCLDDLECIFGIPRWEEALFHFYNRAFEKGVQLIFAADSAPAQARIQMPDLASRLAWGFVYRVHELDDREKVLALRRRAHERGFELPENVAVYLINHYPRDTRALFELLDELDAASLAAQRKLTVPFVRTLLSSEHSSQISLF